MGVALAKGRKFGYSRLSFINLKAVRWLRVEENKVAIKWNSYQVCVCCACVVQRGGTEWLLLVYE